MDIRQLRSFLAVIDQGSFSAAAAALFTVQSNVSAHVARLEEDLGVTLLDRRSRELTPAGRLVESRARAILGQIVGIEDDIAALENRIVGEVACGTTPSVGLWVLPPTLAQASRDFPDIAVTVVEGQSGELAQRIMTGEIDLAITTGPDNPALTSTVLFDEDIVAVLAPDHPLAQRDHVSLADLAATKLLVPLADNPLHSHIAQGFERANIPFRIGLQVGSSALVSAMASAGVGVALVPATAQRNDSTTQPTTRRTVSDLGPRSVALTSRRDTPMNRAMESIAGIIVTNAKQAARSMPGCHMRPDDQPNGQSHVVSIAP